MATTLLDHAQRKPANGKDLISFDEAMEKLSDRIVEHAGIIVNYEGAGVVAMWNAPLRQEDHVLQACGTALAILYTSELRQTS